MFRVHIMISGEVQGVWFRVSAQDKAKELKLTGWVKNIFSNAVEIVAEGEMDNLSELIGWVQDGPPNAKVDKVSIEWAPAENEYSSFKMNIRTDPAILNEPRAAHAAIQNVPRAAHAAILNLKGLTAEPLDD